jgi:Glycosyl transferase family 64 domain
MIRSVWDTFTQPPRPRLSPARSGHGPAGSSSSALPSASASPKFSPPPTVRRTLHSTSMIELSKHHHRGGGNSGSNNNYPDSNEILPLTLFGADQPEGTDKLHLPNYRLKNNPHHHHHQHWSGDSVARRFQVRWRVLSPRTRFFCLCILFPFCLFHIVVGVTDLLFWHYGFGVPPDPHLDTLYPDYAVVINTYQRPEQLRSAVQHYASTCGRRHGVGNVYIVWAEEVTPPPTDHFFPNANTNDSKNLVNRSPVTILRVPNSLNSRFLPITNIQSAVFMVDDDIRVHCPHLQEGFRAWRQNPHSMVGYYPRLAQQHSSDAEFVYQSWPVAFWRNRMNFILTKASFLHARYMILYSDPTVNPKAILEYVDRWFNCEDVAMSMLVANITRLDGDQSSSVAARPIYLEAKVSDKGLFGGISTGSGHMARRSECLRDLTAIYRAHGWETPLKSTFSLRESSWLRHAPGFWWQSRPSNVFEWFALSNIFK